MPAAQDPYRDVTAAVGSVRNRLRQREDLEDRVRALSTLLASLQEQVVAVTEDRDEALTELLARTPRPSNRKLSAALGMSRQRIDQLAARIGAPRPPNGGSGPGRR